MINKRILALFLLTVPAFAAPFTIYTSLSEFGGSLTTTPIVSSVNETPVLMWGLVERVYSTGSPMLAAGLMVDTTPAGPGRGLELLVRWMDGSVQTIGFWGGDGTHVIGFRGVITTSPFQELILRTGDPQHYGIQETVTIGAFYSLGDVPNITHTPEPSTLVLLGCGAALLFTIALARIAAKPKAPQRKPPQKSDSSRPPTF